MQWVVVALGGAFGAMARFGLTTYLLPPAPHRFPVGTLAANLAGCFVIGIAYVVIVEKGLVDPLWRHLIMIGFLGAFTTYSTFSLETIQLWDNGLLGMAIVYAVASLAGSILAAGAGLFLAQKIF